jgi:hypothetical protein
VEVLQSIDSEELIHMVSSLVSCVPDIENGKVSKCIAVSTLNV